MAIIECFRNPENLSSVLTCLREAEGLSGLLAVAVGLALWIVAQLSVDAKREKAANREMKYGLPVSCPSVFGSPAHAEAVLRSANQDYYQLMLAEMEKTLFAQGYELTRDRNLQVVADSETQRKVARAVYIARERYLAPNQPEHELAEKATMASSDGYCARWLSMLITGSERQGWYITRHHQGDATGLTDWQKQMWPVRQVVIVATSDSSVITRDLVRGLNEAVERVSHTPFPDNDNTLSLCTVPVTCPGLQVTLERQLCRTPPGFFPECAGRNVPEELVRKITVPQDGEKRVVAVFAQITSPHSTEMLARYLNAAAEQVAIGVHQGADYDDDNGYAFITTIPTANE